MTGVVEAVTFALAVPGVIDVIVRGGEVVYEKVDTFRKVDQTLAKYDFSCLPLPVLEPLQLTNTLWGSAFGKLHLT
jgi:hypothetical protein